MQNFIVHFITQKIGAGYKLFSFGTLLPNAKEEQMIYILPLKVVGVYLKV